MDSVKVITNHHRRPLLYFWQLDDKQQAFVRKEHDWANLEEEMFFVYRDWVYPLSDFMRFGYGRGVTPDWARGYHAYMNDTFFSGVMIQHVNDETSDWEDCVIVATFYS